MLQRYYQTFGRIGAGITSFAMLTWYLWPRDVPLMEREEALFAFFIAFVFWIATEVKESEEVIFRSATKNDIRVARQMVSYASDKFRFLLREHDFSFGLPPRYLSEAGALVHDFEVGSVFFQDRRVHPMFLDFCESLRKFVDYLSLHSSPEMVSTGMLQYVVPPTIRGTPFETEHRAAVDEVNRLGTAAWEKLLPLISIIRERVPEAFDDPIVYDWFRSIDPIQPR